VERLSSVHRENTTTTRGEREEGGDLDRSKKHPSGERNQLGNSEGSNYLAQSGGESLVKGSSVPAQEYDHNKRLAESRAGKREGRLSKGGRGKNTSRQKGRGRRYAR